MPRWPKQYTKKDLQTAKEMIVDGETTAAIRKDTGMSRSYVIRLKNKYNNSIQFCQGSAVPKRGRKPAIDEFGLRQLFCWLTERSTIDLCGSNILTLERISEVVKRELQCNLSRLQLSRYLKKICLYHPNPTKLISKIASEWLQNDYCSIAAEATDNGAAIIFINSSTVTRDYAKSLAIKSPNQTNSGEKNLVFVYWAITAKGQWRFMVTPNRQSNNQATRFVELLAEEIDRPLHLIVNRAHDPVFFGDVVAGRIQREGWQLHELPCALPLCIA